MPLFRRGSESREPRAFEEVLSEHLDALHRTSLRMCGGREADAEDLLQDATLRAFRSYGSLRDPAAARAWLFTILARTNLNRIRHRQRRPEYAATDLDEDEFEDALSAWRSPRGPDVLADAAFVREHVTAALDALDETLRPVVWLSDVEGFRQREIAEMMGIPEGTVASRLFRARRTLRRLLERAVPVMDAWRNA